MDDNKLRRIKLEVEEDTPNEINKSVDPDLIKKEDTLCVEFKVEIKEEPEDSSDETEPNAHENFDYLSSENSSLADDTFNRQSTKIIPFRTCFVPKCKNTTNKTPEKNFIHVPLITEVRNMWFQFARRSIPNSDKSNYFCCEDHFNLEEDAENYMKHKLTGCSIRMKKGVVPHIFDCQHNRKRSRSPPSSLSETLNKKRLVKDAVEEIHHNDSQPDITDNYNRSYKMSQEQKMSGSGGKRMKPYISSKHLSLVQKIIQPKETISNIITKTNNTGNENQEIDSETNDVSNRNSIVTNDKVISKRIPKRNIKNDVNHLDAKTIKFMDTSSNIEPKIINRHLSFFNGILPLLDKFDDDQVLEFQMGVLHLVKKIKSSRQNCNYGSQYFTQEFQINNNTATINYSSTKLTTIPSL